MGTQIVSPEQLKSILMSSYNDINLTNVPEYSELNTKMNDLFKLHQDNHLTLKSNVDTLNATLLDIGIDAKSQDPERIRSIKWNHYFHKKYKTQTYIVWMILILCVLILLAHSTLPPEVFPVVTGALLSVAFVYVGYLLWDLSMRDNVIFDEYDFFKYSGTNSKLPADSDGSNCIIKNMEANLKKL